MRDLVINVITSQFSKIVPGAGRLTEVAVKSDKQFGFHIVTSPRFICTLKVAENRDTSSGIKIFVKNRPNVDEEYKNMRLLWGAHYARKQDYQIPEPLYISQEHALLFMSYWPGDTFLPLFYKSTGHGRKRRMTLLEDYLRTAARWLVDFQAIYSSPEEKELPLEMFDFETQLTAVTYLDGATRQHIIHKMRRLQNSLPRLRDTYVHDQYLFRNILYRNGAVCVVDFPHLRIGWPLYDFFTFYTGIERLKQYPFLSAATCDHMKEVFAVTYLSEKGLSYNREVLDALWAFYLVGHITKRYRYKRFRGIRGFVNDLFVKQMFNKVANWSLT